MRSRFRTNSQLLNPAIKYGMDRFSGMQERDCSRIGRLDKKDRIEITLSLLPEICLVDQKNNVHEDAADKEGKDRVRGG